MKTSKKIFNILVILAFVMLIISCSKDDPIIPNEEEVITTLSFVLTPNGGGQSQIFSFQDLDGDGGNAPIIQNAILNSETTYIGSLELLNETENPAEDITSEIRTEGEDHQFFYLLGTDSNLSVTYDDSDNGGNPIGIETIVVAGDPETDGTLTIVLRHKPTKSGSGVQTGDITNAGGETDIEVSFNYTIQ